MVVKNQILSGYNMKKAQEYLPTDLGGNGEMAVGSLIYSKYSNPAEAISEGNKAIFPGMMHDNAIESILRIGKIEAWSMTDSAYKTMSKGITVNLGWTSVPYKYEVEVADSIDGAVSKIPNSAAMLYSRDYGNLAAILAPTHWLKFCLTNESIGWIFMYSKTSFTCSITPSSGGIPTTLSATDTQKLLTIPAKGGHNVSLLDAFGGGRKGDDGWDMTEQIDKCEGNYGFGIDFTKIQESTTGLDLPPGDYLIEGTIGFGNQPWRSKGFKDGVKYATDDGVTETLMNIKLKFKVPTAYYLKPSGGQVTGRRRRRT
jgi:hypothetical protein